MPSQQLEAKFQCSGSGAGGNGAFWGVLTSYGTSQEQASRANLPIFVCKGSLHVSVAREIDGWERNVPQKACFGTLSVGKGRKTTWNTYPIEKIKLLWNLSWNKIFPEKTELYSQGEKVTEKKKSIAQILQVINLNFLFKNKTNFIEEEGVVLAFSNSKISIQVILGLCLWQPFPTDGRSLAFQGGFVLRRWAATAKMPLCSYTRK